MRQALCPALAFIMFLPLLAGQEKKLPPQAERGRDLFLNNDKGAACGNCHVLGGVGSAIGPDLKVLGSAVGPHGLVMAMRMTITAYVQEVKLTSGVSYPGMLKQKQGDEMEIWDLGQTPPVLRKVSSKEVASMKANTVWKHPPAAIEYPAQDLADIVGFVKWASTGSVKAIKPVDVVDAK